MTPAELRAYRVERDLTRRQVAALLGVAPTTVRNWEQGFRNMPAPADLALRRVTKPMIERAKREHPAPRPTTADAGAGAAEQDR